MSVCHVSRDLGSCQKEFCMDMLGDHINKMRNGWFWGVKKLVMGFNKSYRCDLEYN